jgi:hypothetical protein
MPTIGIGIDADAIIALMKELCIKQDRMEFLVNLLNSDHKTGNPADELQRFIATSTKANEVAFLSFMCGFGYGAAHTIQNLNGDVEKIAKMGMLVGAAHAGEIKEAIKNFSTNEGEKPSIIAAGDNADEIQELIRKIQSDELGITPEKKKKEEKEDERMYG